MKINGQIIQSYFICKRQTWFLLNHISFSHESDLMMRGRIVHEKTFRRERKNLILDGIAIDFKRNKRNIVIFEIKKSSKMEKSAEWQLYFYLLYLKRKGIDATGVLTYPKERKRKNMALDKDKEMQLEEIINWFKENLEDEDKIIIYTLKSKRFLRRKEIGKSQPMTRIL